MKEWQQWLISFGVPVVLISIIWPGTGLLLLPLGGIVGVVVGLGATAPYFTVGFKLIFAASLVACAGLFFVGLRFRHRFYGKIIVSAAVIIWCFIGLVGFRPQ